MCLLVALDLVSDTSVSYNFKINKHLSRHYIYIDTILQCDLKVATCIILY